MSCAISQIDPSGDARPAVSLSSLAAAAVDGDGPKADLLAQRGTEDVPACLACHGPSNRNPLIPSPDGQDWECLEQQLILWCAGQRGDGQRAALMHSVADDLTDQQIEEIATYFSARTPQAFQVTPSSKAVAEPLPRRRPAAAVTIA